MGIGDIVLNFSCRDVGQGIKIELATKFEWTSAGELVVGDGAAPASITTVYPLLNLTVSRARQKDNGQFVVTFEDGKNLTIFSRADGYESYVIYLPGAIGGIVCY